MDDSILDSIKDIVGVGTEDDVFDGELIVVINTAFFTLYQLGVGGDKPFTITSNSECWNDFIDNIDELSMVKSYIGLKTRILFDPPTSSPLMDAIKNQIAEYEWRLNVECDKSWEATIDG